MNEYGITLEEYIRLQCKRRGVSLSALAGGIGKKPANFLNQLSRGDFRVSDLEKMAAFLGCDFKYSFEDREE